MLEHWTCSPFVIRRRIRKWPNVLFLMFVVATSITGQQPRGGQGLSLEQLMDIKHPSNPAWSPDGRSVAFLWDRAGAKNLFVANADGSGEPRRLSSIADENIGEPAWSRDGQWIYFERNSELMQVRPSGEQLRPVWSQSVKGSEFEVSPNRTEVAYVHRSSGDAQPQGSELCVRRLSDSSPESCVARDDHNIYGLRWSPDGSHISYNAGLRLVHHDESPEYSGAKISYGVVEYVPGQLKVVSALGGEPVTITTASRFATGRWVDNQHLVYAHETDDFKKRTIFLADIASAAPKTIHEDVEDKFWSIPGDAGDYPQPSPDGRWIAFLSDRDGWDHLYVMPATGGEPVQITHGHFEAWRPSWSHDSKRIAFDANAPEHPGDRHLSVANIGNDPSHATVTILTVGSGTDTAPCWSADDRRLLYQHTDPHNSADLFAIEASANAKPVRLSDSMPVSMDRSAFVEPEFVHYPGANGEQVPGWLFVPKKLDRSKKHPVVLWIHGDGINQNYDGWHIQRNYAVYYSFHQYLLQKGYIVFAPDYRGSIGYGRDWRTGVYMKVGTDDAKDAWMAANYLESLPYVDTQRIGVWGLSYGGFFTLIAMTDQPTLFRAGVDVAGVVDYTMYYNDPYHGGWTRSRIGTPEENPQVYAAASPVSHIDQLARPLLVLHGTADVNVPFLESVRLMDEVLKKKKGDLVTFMIYPGEFHYFTREHVLLDAWHRVDRFFDTYLQENAGAVR
jgi:dipeptidyl aminopeptidase/acylaminoacyl peptidase